MLARDGKQIGLLHRDPVFHSELIGEAVYSLKAFVMAMMALVADEIARIEAPKLPTANALKRLRLMLLQVVLYGAIITGAVGTVFYGSEVLIYMLSAKMTAMGTDVIRQNMPKGIETARLRPTLE